MPKTLAEEIREMMNKVEEAMGHHYDMELKVENWENPEDPNDENWPAYRTLGINYSISGKYRPATWGYHGGEPEEHPELDEIEVFDAETGQPIQNLPKEIDDQIEQAIWKDAEKRKEDDFEPPNKDDFYD